MTDGEDAENMTSQPIVGVDAVSDADIPNTSPLLPEQDSVQEVKETTRSSEFVSPELKNAVFDAIDSDPNRLTVIAEDVGDFSHVSAAILAFTGYTREEAVGMNYIDIVAPEDQVSVKEAYENAQNEEFVRIAFRVVAKNGETRWGDASFSRLSTGGVVISMTDATESIAELDRLKQERDEATEMSLYDPLTGLYSRYHFGESLNELKEEAKRTNKFPTGVVYMDLDKFKTINDTYGHAIGDKALKRVGKIVSESIRKVDTAARLGGDEFAILLPLADESAVKDVINRIDAAVEASNSDEFWGNMPDISLSMGYSVATNIDALDNIVDRADKAMYEIKKKTRDGERLRNKFAKAVLSVLSVRPASQST